MLIKNEELTDIFTNQEASISNEQSSFHNGQQPHPGNYQKVFPFGTSCSSRFTGWKVGFMVAKLSAIAAFQVNHVLPSFCQC